MSRHCKPKIKQKTNRLRIIAGQWRGRALQFPDLVALRPTPDRVRETLFNWLQVIIPGARCLDLFTGSGVLGFEALSRGASEVIFVDHDQTVVKHIQKYHQVFATPTAHVVHAEWSAFLTSTMYQQKYGQFDVVFVDPPYHQDLLKEICASLEQHNWLANKAWIYLESEQDLEPLLLPAKWQLLKNSKAGQVAYHLGYRELSPNP